MVGTREEFRQHLPDAEVVYGNLSTHLDAASRLEWVQTGAAGVEGLDPKIAENPIVLTNMAKTFAPAISETAMGLLLCLTRGITTLYMPQFAKRQMKPIGTVKSADHVELAGRTMGIVGMGGIGSAVARKAHHGFGMTVVATDARPLPKPDFVSELHDPSWFETMARQVDVLVAAAPHTLTHRGHVQRARLPEHEEDRVLPRAFTRQALRRHGARQGAPGRMDCGRRARRLSTGTPALESSDLRLHQRRHDGAHVRVEPRPSGPARGALCRERAAIRHRRSAYERRRQEGRLLTTLVSYE